jgi:hypothetical protein
MGKSYFIGCCLLLSLLTCTLGQKYPPCNICGDEKDGITKPDGIFTPPEPNDPITCRDLYMAGQDGILSVSDCLVLPLIVYEICGCQSNLETSSPMSIPSSPRPSPTTTIPIKTKKPKKSIVKMTMKKKKNE